MKHLLISLLAVLFLASAAGAAEFGVATRGTDFRAAKDEVKEQIKDLNKDTRGSGVKWKGFMAYCSCRDARGKVAYAYDIVSGDMSATTLLRELEDFTEKECGGCGKSPKIASLKSSYKSTKRVAKKKKPVEQKAVTTAPPAYATRYWVPRRFVRPLRPIGPWRRAWLGY